ncbi:MAG: hypothetical protein ACJA1L_002745, partial [Paracoccaceae bacterium]
SLIWGRGPADTVSPSAGPNQQVLPPLERRSLDDLSTVYPEICVHDADAIACATVEPVGLDTTIPPENELGMRSWTVSHRHEMRGFRIFGAAKIQGAGRCGLDGVIDDNPYLRRSFEYVRLSWESSQPHSPLTARDWGSARLGTDPDDVAGWADPSRLLTACRERLQ